VTFETSVTNPAQVSLAADLVFSCGASARASSP
jgi:hypothetical protein